MNTFVLMPDQNISFDFKCSQKWDELQHTGCAGQKFCLQCKTPVHDLSEKSRSEIIELIQQNNNHLCGSFYADQLADEEPKSFFHPRLALAGIAAWLTFSAPKASAQQSNTVTIEQHDASTVNTSKQVDRDQHTVDGYPVCFLDEAPAVASPKKLQGGRSISLFRIGNKRVYLSKRFPLIHIGRRYCVLGSLAF
jgi:hypothetical protein